MTKNEQEIYNKLLAKAKELGRPPTTDEIIKDPNLPPLGRVAYYFGDYKTVAHDIELALRIPKTEDGRTTATVKKRITTGPGKAPLGVVTPKVEVHRSSQPGKSLSKGFATKEQKTKAKQKISLLGGGRLRSRCPPLVVAA